MKKLLLTLIVLLSFYQVNASHLLGGELYYEQDAVNPNKYKITLILYGDASTSGSSMGSFQNITTNITGVATLKLYLASSQPTTYKVNCLKSIESFRYFGYVTINSIPAGGIDFSWYSCCRAVGIDNLNFSQSRWLALKARMFTHGSSSRFIIPPVYSGVAGVLQDFNIMVSDSDKNDSTNVILVNPKEGNILTTPTNIPYNTGFTVKKPFGTSVHTKLDSHGGILSVDSVPIGTYSVAFLIRTFRNGIVTSVVVRDVVFYFSTTGDLPKIDLQNIQGTSVIKKKGKSYYVEMTEGDDLSFRVKGVNPLDTSKLVSVLGYGNLLTNNSGGSNCGGKNCALFSATNGSFANNGVSFADFTFSPDTSFVDNLDNKYYQNFSFSAEVIDTCGAKRKSSIGVFITINKAQSMYSVSSYTSCKGVGVKAQIHGDTSSVLWSPPYGVSDTLSASPILNPDSNMVYTVSNSISGVSFKVHVFVDSIGASSFLLINTGTELIVPTLDSLQTHNWFYNGALLPVSADTLPLLLTGFYWASIQKGVCIIFSDTIKSKVYLKTSNSNAGGSSVQVNSSNSSFEFSLNQYSNTLTDLDIVLPKPGFNKTTATVNVVISQGGSVIKSLAAQKENEYLWKVENINSLLSPGLTYKIEVTTDQAEMVLFKPQTLPFTEDNGIVNIISGQYTENGNVIQGAYPYVNFVFSSPIGIKENNLVANIYPNPAANLLFIEMQGVGSFKVLDIQGRIVLNAEVDGDVKLDISELTSGIYIYTLENELGVKMGKLVVE